MANLRGRMHQKDYLRVRYVDMPTLSGMGGAAEGTLGWLDGEENLSAAT